MYDLIIFKTLKICLGISIFGYILSKIINKNDIADTIWGLGFLFISLFHINSFANLTVKSKLILVLLSLWSLRLSIYLFIRSYKKPEDIRYINMRKSWGKNDNIHSFIKVFLLQSILMGIISYPLSIIFVNNTREILSTDFLALSLFIIGFLFETIADIQLMQFKSKSENEGKILDKGLWSYTRHPNYFGEVLIWWSFYLFSIGADGGLISIVSPLLLTFLIIRISGIGMMEPLLANKGIEHHRYKLNTPIFFPVTLKNIVYFFKISAVIVLLDYLWLGLIMKEFYIEQARKIARLTEGNFDTILWAAVGVYIFIPFAILFFALNKHTDTRASATFKGACLGFSVYAVYELTNIALIKNWPLEMGLIDILWGPILCGLTAFVCFTKPQPAKLME